MRSERLPSRNSLASDEASGMREVMVSGDARLELVENLGQRRGVVLVHGEDDGLAELARPGRVCASLQERLAHDAVAVRA